MRLKILTNCIKWPFRHPIKTGLLLLCLISLPYFVHTYFDERTDSLISEDLQDMPNAEAALILGAKVFPDGRLSSMEQDFGMGPAFYLTSEEVKQVDIQLQAVKIEDFKTAFKPKLMQNVYPSFWDEDVDNNLNYLVDYFEDLRNFYSMASKEGQGVISWIS